MEYNSYKGWDPSFYPLEELDRRNKIRRGELEDHSPEGKELQPLSDEEEDHPPEQKQLQLLSAVTFSDEEEISTDEEEDDFGSVSQTAIAVAANSAIALPSKLGGYAAPLDDDPFELFDRRKLKVEAQIRKYMCALPGEYLGMAQYQDAEKQLKELERREELYYNMRKKYPRWYLDSSVGEFEKTKTVLFNPKTGEDVPVKNYDDIANYFLSHGYVDFLSPKDCAWHWDCGRVEFPAQKVCKAKPEETQEISACKTTTREEIREESRERTVQETTVQKRVQDGILQRVVVETETTEESNSANEDSAKGDSGRRTSDNSLVVAV